MVEEKKEKKDVAAEEPKVTKPAATPPPAEDKKVEVSESVLQELIDRDKKRDEDFGNLKKQNERLLHAADKSRLAHFDQQNPETLIRVAQISVWPDPKTNEDTLVLGWRTTKDEVYFADGKLIEHQVVELFLDQGEGKDPVNVEVEYLKWARGVKKIEGEVVKESKTAQGVLQTLKLEDGREIEMDIRFIN